MAMPNWFASYSKVLSDETFPSLNSPPYPQSKGRGARHHSLTAMKRHRLIWSVSTSRLGKHAGVCMAVVLVGCSDKVHEVTPTGAPGITSQRSFSA